LTFEEYNLDVFEAIKGRRSIREFTKQDVSKDSVEKIIDAARMAPSAGNIQPWEFVVIRDAQTKRKIAEAALGQMFIATAPVIIVVCAHLRRSAQGYGSRGEKLYAIQDTAAATENILLSAHALGLGTCWIGAFEEDEVKEVLDLPSEVRPVAIIPVGYPAEKSSPPHRRHLDEIIHMDKF